jgi:hypothetical protein
VKFNTWPGVTAKYSGVLAGISAAALLAVTTAVESMVIQRASVEASRTCLVWLPNGVLNCVALVGRMADLLSEMSAHVERAIPGHAPTALSVFRFVIVPDD